MTHGHDALAPLATEYVLGTLSGADAQRFREHLEGCAECQREVRDIAAAGEALARSLDPIAPPAALRARVLSRATGAPAIGVTPPAATPARGTRWEWLAAAAALVAMVMTAATFYYRNEAIRARDQQAQAAQHAADLEQQIAVLRANAATSEQTTTVLTAADLSRVDLKGLDPAPGAIGRVFWSPTHGLVFAATNLPPLPPGRVYQLWVVAGQPISAGIAQPSAGGFSVVNPATVPSAAQTFAVTIEPEGGRPAPTGPMFLAGSM